MKIGILGGGQLAQMMAKAGAKSGHEFMFFSDDPRSCAAPFGKILCAPFDDVDAQNDMTQWADVVTYEFENIPLDAVRRMESQVPLYPSSTVLATASDRLVEKRLFRTLGIQTVDFYPVENAEQVAEAFSALGNEAILKTRREGYDGKGQALITHSQQIDTAWQKVGRVSSILEQKVSFQREVSIIAARSLSGEIVYYPLSENVHREGILRLSIARVDDPFQARAEKMIRKLMENLNYVGVMALELFQIGNELFANEIAPRVHNTGHWTIEGAVTSQFENHLRAISGATLGDTSVSQLTAMVNLVGTLPPESAVAEVPGATYHNYGKEERPGRKVGHITLKSGSNEHALDKFFESLDALLKIAGEPGLRGRYDLSGARV